MNEISDFSDELLDGHALEKYYAPQKIMHNGVEVDARVATIKPHKRVSVSYHLHEDGEVNYYASQTEHAFVRFFAKLGIADINVQDKLRTIIAAYQSERTAVSLMIEKVCKTNPERYEPCGPSKRKKRRPKNQ